MLSAGARSVVPDRLLEGLQKEYARYANDPIAVRAIAFLVALPVCSRSESPSKLLHEWFSISLYGTDEEDIFAAINASLPVDHPFKTALIRTINFTLNTATSENSLFQPDPWQVWRSFDGSPFCDLARRFFTELNAICFSRRLSGARLRVDGRVIRRFAHEMSVITRAFSARWFNACARYQIPEMGSIQWYLGHCLGKLDLELCREASNWVEPSGNPWRRRRVAPPALELDG